MNANLAPASTVVDPSARLKPLMDKIVAGFESQFAQMQSKVEREKLLCKILVENWVPRAPDYKGAPRDHETRPENVELISAISVLADKYGLNDSLMNITTDIITGKMHHDENPWSGPLEFLPCANVNIRLHDKCPNAGVKACSGCRLVSYCTNACQTEHWRTHKKDCKAEVNHIDWIPHWIAENRDPSFSKAGAGEDSRPERLTQKLLGDIPAIDVVKLGQNEGLQSKKDLSLVFAASGDLRDTVLSINAMPANYPGRISITINDSNPHIAARNLLILLAIARVKSTTLAADIALHLWYSAFIPTTYNDRIMAFTLPALSTVQGGRMDWASGKLRVIGDLSPAVEDLFTSYHERKLLDRNVATENYLRAMFSPNRVDELDRDLCKLKPAHRLAIKSHRTHGLLLPFGAVKSAFDTPNVTLFTRKGEWLQEDFASPLAGWDILSVISVGKAHGVKEEDLFGCLYFYLSEQLAMFKDRLSKLHVTIYLSNMDSQGLAKEIMSKRSLPNTIGPLLYPAGLPTIFDRIILSNIVEKGSVGYEHALSDWAPLLNAGNPWATVLSYTKYWHVNHPHGQNERRSEQNRQTFLQEKGRLIPRLNETKFPNVICPTQYTVVAMVWHCASPTMYDDSEEFEQYLVAQGLYKSMKGLNLHIKVKHTIIPKRSGIPLSAPLCTLPKFKDDDEWYIRVLLSREGFLVRYQEFSRNTK